MSANTSLYATLAAYAGLQALIGNGDSPVTSRIHPHLMPQDPTLPAVTYQLVAGTRANTLSDAGSTGVERNMYQLVAWATTLSSADAVMDQVRLALKNAAINYVPLSKRESYDSETKLFGVQYDFAQWYR